MTDECCHDDWRAEVAVYKFEDRPGLVSVEVKVQCAACGEPLIFHGAPIGSSSYRPTVAFGGGELRAPATFGGFAVPEGLPGFVVNHVPGKA